MPQLPDITIAGRKEATELLSSSVSWSFTHVISINDPDQDPPGTLKKHKRKQLCLFFHDVIDPPQLVRGTGLVAPSRTDVDKIVEFASDIRAGHHLLVHCGHGISRSSAAALVVVASKLERGPAGAVGAVKAVMRAKPTIKPNPNMVADADAVLGYGGSLVDACHSAFQGGELSWVPPQLDLEEE